ncbi:MAG TPA: hypothetical protein VM141_13030 [Planctomycetota bacterium]|nr:hypothetical protein [Planctomycetota bacterium]
MKQRLLCFLLAAMPLLYGCIFTDQSLNDPTVTVGPRPIYDDVPVMTGLKFLDTSIYIDTPQYRACELRYVGAVQPLTAVYFYKQQMPAKGWRYVTLVSAGGTHTIDFKKNNEKCTVTVGSKGEDTAVTIKITNDSSTNPPGETKGR